MRMNIYAKQLTFLESKKWSWSISWSFTHRIERYGDRLVNVMLIISEFSFRIISWIKFNKFTILNCSRWVFKYFLFSLFNQQWLCSLHILYLFSFQFNSFKFSSITCRFFLTFILYGLKLIQCLLSRFSLRTKCIIVKIKKQNFKIKREWEFHVQVREVATHRIFFACSLTFRSCRFNECLSFKLLILHQKSRDGIF